MLAESDYRSSQYIGKSDWLQIYKAGWAEHGHLCFRIMKNDKLTSEIQRQRYREKPYQERNRLAFERCKRIYNNEMKRKIDFLMQKNRVDPCPNWSIHGCLDI